MFGSFGEMLEHEDNVQDFTVDGKCSGCGQCCSNYLPLARHEIDTIKRYIEKHNVKEVIRVSPSTGVTVDMVCPFRSDIEQKCLIYPVRPGICKDFRCDKLRKKIDASKRRFHQRHEVCDMRKTFYGRESELKKYFAELVRGIK